MVNPLDTKLSLDLKLQINNLTKEIESYEGVTKFQKILYGITYYLGWSSNTSNDDGDDPEQQVKKKVKIDMSELEEKKRALNNKQLYLNSLMKENAKTSSKKFQWLPSDFQVSNDGKVTFLSYINNLDPRMN